MNIAQLKRRRRILILLLGVVAFSISLGLVLIATRDSLIYFYSPTEILEKNNIDNRLIRIGGLVKEGSMKKQENMFISFLVEDGSNEIMVKYQGILPDLFREGQGVICEGTISRNNIFLADKILAKHDENYMPPEVVEALKDSGKWKEGDEN